MFGKENPLVSVAETEINQTPINKRLVRLVWESPSTKKADDNLYMLLTRRPGWSKVGAGTKALAGGKMEENDYAYSTEIDNCSIEEHIKAAKIAMCREIMEEFAFDITPDQLELVDVLANTGNDLGYINFVFYIKSEKRPELMLRAGNDGIEWILREIIKNGGEKLFADHPYLIKIVLEYLADRDSN